MRHGKKFNHLSRKRGHRKSMLSNMACSLIEHKRINTTVAKAKALKVFVEPLITKSKEDTTHSRRSAFRYLRSKEAVIELFREIAPKIAERPGGYTRIIKMGNRLGDNAEMCMIELVDFNELLLGTDDGAKKTRRSRRGKGSGSNTSSASTEAKKDETKSETPKDTKAEESKEESPKAEAKEVKKEETPKAETKSNESKEVKKEEAPKAETKKEDVKKEDTPKADASKKEEAPKADDKKDPKEEK